MGREDLIVTDERVSKETKLHIAKELVASYVRSDASRDVRPEQLGDLFMTVFNKLDAAFPEPGERKIGLGL